MIRATLDAPAAVRAMWAVSAPTPWEVIATELNRAIQGARERTGDNGIGVRVHDGPRIEVVIRGEVTTRNFGRRTSVVVLAQHLRPSVAVAFLENMGRASCASSVETADSVRPVAAPASSGKH